MADSSVAITPGAGTSIDTYQVGTDHRQLVIPADHGGYLGRFTSYVIPGRAGTTGQNLAGIWNAAGSTVVVDVNLVGIDLAQTVAKTVVPPVVRTMKLTTIPTSGTAGWKVPEDSGRPATNASVSLFQDASAESTSSGTALAFTQTAATSALSQEWAPRVLTVASYEPADRMEFHNEHPVTLRAGEGLGVRLHYTVATSNPTTDMYVVTLRWEEYLP